MFRRINGAMSESRCFRLIAKMLALSGGCQTVMQPQKDCFIVPRSAGLLAMTDIEVIASPRLAEGVAI